MFRVDKNKARKERIEVQDAWSQGVLDSIKVIRWRQARATRGLRHTYEELIECLSAMRERSSFFQYADVDACDQCGKLKCLHSSEDQEECKFLRGVAREIDSMRKKR